MAANTEEIVYTDEELAEAQRRQVLSVVRDLACGTPSALAHAMLLDAGEAETMQPKWCGTCATWCSLG